jgi:hypothetical protein
MMITGKAQIFDEIKNLKTFYQGCMATELSGLISRKTKPEILAELQKSSQKRNVLGLFIDGQEEMVTTAVTQVIETNADVMIYFETTDLHGYALEENPVILSKIRSVVPFHTLFNDPVYVKIRERRSSGNVAA